jgi:hypothetical protein
VHRQGQAPYELGVKATTLKRSKGGQFALHAMVLPGNRMMTLARNDHSRDGRHPAFGGHQSRHATIGSTVAARTQGEVIIAGLLSNNLAFVLQGGLIVAALAVLIYDGLSAIERYTRTPPGAEAA